MASAAPPALPVRGDELSNVLEKVHSVLSEVPTRSAPPATVDSTPGSVMDDLQKAEARVHGITRTKLGAQLPDSQLGDGTIPSDWEQNEVDALLGAEGRRRPKPAQSDLSGYINNNLGPRSSASKPGAAASRLLDTLSAQPPHGEDAGLEKPSLWKAPKKKYPGSSENSYQSWRNARAVGSTRNNRERAEPVLPPLETRSRVARLAAVTGYAEAPTHGQLSNRGTFAREISVISDGSGD
jgi:hypothetical protein